MTKLNLPSNKAQKYINGLTISLTSFYLYGLIGSLETDRINIPQFNAQCLTTVLISLTAYIVLTYVNYNIKEYLRTRYKNSKSNNIKVILDNAS